MIPRSFWDEDPRFLDTFTAAHREGIRMRFGESSFSSSTKYLCVLCCTQSTSMALLTFAFQANGPVRAVEIVEALIAATRPEDLTDAFAWFENMLPAQPAQEILQVIRNRATIVHGYTASQGSVPIPTRALNNEVAYMMMDAMDFVFDIHLTGLRSATHLNGREGVICGMDPANSERWTARLDGGMYISVKSANFVPVRRGDYRRVSP
jgi:membrane peptidoglycan carboxypeptidase